MEKVDHFRMSFVKKYGWLVVKLMRLPLILWARLKNRATPDSEPYQFVPGYTDIFHRLEIPESRSATMLDFGCGIGECVDQFHKAGYQVFGCDIALPDKPDSRLMGYMEKGVIRQIQDQPYKVPFDDNFFDVVFSNQVFEHVMNYDTVLSEIRRILKPGGFGVHVFPGRWRMREPHTLVPFASIVKVYWWLYIWAMAGIRNHFQQGLTAGETAKINARYLKEETSYLTRKQILKQVTHYFHECQFAEEAYFYPNYERFFREFPSLLPVFRAWFSDTDMRLLVFRKAK